MPDPRIRRLENILPGILPAGPYLAPDRRHTFIDRQLEAEKIGSTVEDLTVTGTLSHTGDLKGSFGVAAVAQQGPFTQTYATADATLSAYTPDVESVAYTGLATGLGATPYAAVTDLEALRTAYENLRAFTEDLAAFTNAIVNALQNLGDFG